MTWIDFCFRCGHFLSVHIEGACYHCDCELSDPDQPAPPDPDDDESVQT